MLSVGSHACRTLLLPSSILPSRPSARSFLAQPAPPLFSESRQHAPRGLPATMAPPRRLFHATRWASQAEPPAGATPEFSAGTVPNGADFAKKLGTIGTALGALSASEQERLVRLVVRQVIGLSEAPQLQLLPPAPQDSLLGSKEAVPGERSSEASHGEEAIVGSAEEDGWSAIHNAAWDRDLPEVTRLLKLEGKELLLAKEPENGSTPLQIAAIHAQLKMVKLMTKEGGRDVLMARDHLGRTALHDAALHGHLKVVKHLAAKGGRELLMAQDKVGNTALHAAAKDGRLDVAKHLAEVGGEELLKSTNKNRRTASTVAQLGLHLDIWSHLDGWGSWPPTAPEPRAKGGAEVKAS